MEELAIIKIQFMTKHTSFFACRWTPDTGRKYSLINNKIPRNL